MMKSLLVLLFACLFLWAEGVSFRYRTFFPDGKIPASGIVDEEGHFGPLRLVGGVSVAPSGALRLDGKTGYLAIPESSGISLRNGVTLLMIVKFSEEKPGALFYRRGELLLAYSTIRQFYCNFLEAKTGSPGIRVGEYQHLAVVLTPVRNGKLEIRTYVNGKLMNRPRPTAVGTSSATSAELAFGHAPDRGSAWFFKGEVAELSLVSRVLSPSELAADIRRFLGREIIDEPLHGNIGKGKLRGGAPLPAGNRKSKKNRALQLTDSQVEWAPNATGDWFAEVMFKSLSSPGKKRELMKLELGSERWSIEIPANSSEVFLTNEAGTQKLSFPSGTLQTQPWMTNDAMWHYLTLVRKEGKLHLAFDGFFASGAVDAAEPLGAIAIGGAGRAAFSEFRLLKGTLTKEELRARYLALYQADDGESGLLSISEKLNEKINRR